MDEKYTLISYDESEIEHYTSADLDDVLSRVQADRVSWIILQGFADSDRPEIEKLLSFFTGDTSLTHKVLDEEGLDFSDPPPNCLFYRYAVPTTKYDASKNEYVENQGSVILGKEYLLLFDETGQGFSDEVQHSLQRGRTRAQEYGADYLLYLLIRLAIWNFDILISDELLRRVEALEVDVMSSPGDSDNLDKLTALQGDFRALYEPLRSLDIFVNSFRDEVGWEISPAALPLFTGTLRDDTREVERSYLRLREMLKELLEAHRASMSEISNSKMNLLTIMSTIFLPITFISGVYGMNFQNMPGANYQYGFIVTMLLMVVIVVVEIIYLKKNGFFS